jgi:hypothetical protein
VNSLNERLLNFLAVQALSSFPLSFISRLFIYSVSSSAKKSHVNMVPYHTNVQYINSDFLT